MGIGFSIFLIAIGAVLTYAVEAEVSGINLDAVGVILMLAGAVGAVLSIVFWSSWGGFRGRSATVRERRVVEDI